MTGRDVLPCGPIQRHDDQVDPLGMPPLYRLVVSTDRGAQATPGEQVPLGDRMDQAAGTDDASQHEAIEWDQRNPPHCLIHPGDLRGRRDRRPYALGGPAIVLDRGPRNLERRTAQLGGPTGPWQSKQGGAGLLQAADQQLRVEPPRLRSLDRAHQWFL